MGPLTRFSVVVPAWNEEACLGACLDSIASQDYSGSVEVVVVDNNSTDSTAEVARAHGARVVFEGEQGVCAARQAGADAAVGDVVVSTDADTVFDRAWLSRIDARLRSDPALVAVAGPCHWVDAPWWGRAYERLLFRSVGLLFRITGNIVYASATNIAFRKVKWHGYDTTLTQGGDELDLLRRLRSEGPMAWDPDNRTLTSSRRLRAGLGYNLVVTAGYYYIGGYVLNRVFRRQVLGMAPAFRDTADGEVVTTPHGAEVRVPAATLLPARHHRDVGKPAA
ncbi:glycosyl transferase [Janibacter sp. HTCC2649]|uniref:glycosyltransferase family 2 protein n=1 Tax=Janibacter sp. HTCC2649 TaxID=313589 RepID=UPI000066EA67|nr:glycosyltransferase family 2 protein [Janibacter sp. HTCC2649]EAP99018.1 glycosyl transferase [Janibacter sp. HTCC2649]